MTGTTRASTTATRFVRCVLLVGAGAIQTGVCEAEALAPTVLVSPSFFNPGIGQKATVSFAADRAGTAHLTILDRDRFPIRALQAAVVKPGAATIEWDGKDDKGALVPDEAYAVRIEFKSSGPVEVYDPSDGFTAIADNPSAGTYGRVDGVLSYRLLRPARVHVQAGQTVGESPGGSPAGPVLRTIVDRQPRIGGAIVERWNGFDEGGTIYIPDLKGFRISVAAMSLPESSIITTGNRTVSFVDYARSRRPAADQKPRVLAHAGHQHHQGLNVFEDHCPGLTVTLAAKKADKGADLVPAGTPLKLKVSLEPDRAPHFFSQPATLMVFVDERAVSVTQTNRNPAEVTIAGKDLPAGEHRIAVNWASAFGPVAVWARRVSAGQAAAAQGRKP